MPPHLRDVNTVFQKYALFPHLNVFDNVAFGLKLKKEDKKVIEKKVKQALKTVGMTDYEYRDVDSLSGGQQQRVAIARAVVTNPKIIFADEPTGNLDSRNGIEVMELLKQLNGEGTTVVMVTHSLRDASYAGRVINMFDGQVATEIHQ
jgi:spermidine/putrescine transport system ATP-binding protein